MLLQQAREEVYPSRIIWPEYGRDLIPDVEIVHLVSDEHRLDKHLSIVDAKIGHVGRTELARHKAALPCVELELRPLYRESGQQIGTFR